MDVSPLTAVTRSQASQKLHDIMAQLQVTASRQESVQNTNAPTSGPMRGEAAGHARESLAAVFQQTASEVRAASRAPLTPPPESASAALRLLRKYQEIAGAHTNVAELMGEKLSQVAEGPDLGKLEPPPPATASAEEHRAWEARALEQRVNNSAAINLWHVNHAREMAALNMMFATSLAKVRIAGSLGTAAIKSVKEILNSAG